MATPRKKPEERPKMGRPTDYSPELANRICEIVSTDTRSLKELCENYEEMPNSPGTIHLWRIKNQNFSDKYLQAMINRGNLYAEETIDIAAQKHTYIDEKGNERVDAGHVAWQKMNVNLRQWHASKLAPKTYGDKKTDDNTNNPQDTLSKIQELVADLSKK